MRYIWILIIIASSCKFFKTDIPLNNKWIDKNSLSEVYFSSEYFYINNRQYNYRIIRKDLVIKEFIDTTNKSPNYIYEPPVSEYLKILFISKDSFIFQRVENIESFTKNKCYLKKYLYDSTLNLNSITFELGVVEGGYPNQAFTLNKNTLYFRVDSGITEIKPNVFTRKMIDYKAKTHDTLFNKVQDYLRLINISNFDSIFPYRATSHSFWNVTIKYNDSIKRFKGINLPLEFFPIWEKVEEYIYFVDKEKIEDKFGIRWSNK